MAEEAKWYIIHTYSGYENKVASNLEKIIENRGFSDLITEVYVPTEIVTEIKDGKKKETEKKVFPSYVLVKMILNDETWYVVRNVRGCTGFVGESAKPLPLTKEEVDRLGVNKKTIEVEYQVGDTVVIIDGALQNSHGKVTEIDKDNNIAKVEVSLFGRKTPVDLELDQIELVK